jgi:hypothetical protein
MSYILRRIYTPYAGAAGMLLHINGKFTMGKLKSYWLRLEDAKLDRTLVIKNNLDSF